MDNKLNAYVPPLPRYEKPAPPEAPQGSSWLFRIVLIVMSIAGFALFAANTVFSFFSSPVGNAIGLAFTILYAVIAIWLIRRSPMYPKHTPGSFRFWWAVACLLWGGGAGLVFSLVVGTPVTELTQRSGWEDSLFSWGGAYPEEIGKALGVAVILFSFKHLTRPWHGAVTGLMIGLGFETSENIGYGGMGAMMDPYSDFMGSVASWGGRMVAGVGLHMITTAIAGWGIGWAVFALRRSLGSRIAGALGCFLIGFAIHFAWNYTIDNPIAMIVKSVTVALVMYAALFVLITRGNEAARREQHGPCTPRSISADGAPQPAAGYSPYTRSNVAETSAATSATD